MNTVHRHFNRLSTLQKASIVLLLVVSCSAIIGGLYRARTTGPVDFALRQKVSASANLTLSFPYAMNHRSVEDNAEYQSGLLGSSSWSDETWIITPKTVRSIGDAIDIRIPASTQKQDGSILGTDLVYHFEITSDPAISAVVPTGESLDVPADAQISIVFDRPIVPLRQVQGEASSMLFRSWPVKIFPSTEGTWRWMGSTTATFIPSQPLHLGTRYKITVPAGVKTLAGDSIDTEFSWSFETERPRLLSSTPQNASNSSGPTTEISAQFNQSIDLLRIKDSLELASLGSATAASTGSKDAKTAKSILPIASVRYGKKLVDTKEVQDNESVIITPTKPLAFGTAYALTLKKGLRGTEGELGTAEETVVQFQTVGDFIVRSSEYINSALRLHFSSPVLGEVLRKNLVIVPPVALPENFPDTYQSYDGSSTHILDFYLPFTPGTSYTVRLGDGMRDSYGQVLKKAWSYTFKTPDAEPSAFIHPRYTPYSIFERGKAPIYYVNGMNVSTLDVSFAELDFSAFKKLSADRTFRYERNLGNVDLHAYASKVTELHVPSTSAKNTWQSKTLDLDKSVGTLKPGLYAFTLNAKELTNGQDTRVFAITNLGVTLKYSGKKALVWVADIVTGEPVRGARVVFHSMSSEETLTGSTDKDGFFETEISLKKYYDPQRSYIPEFFVTVEKDDDYTFVGSDWNQGFQPYDFDGVSQDFRSPDSPAHRLESFIYTDRPLYRAGDMVYFKGLLRFLDDNGNLSLPSKTTKSVAVTITDQENKQVYAKTLRLSDFASFNDSFQSAKEASLGSYSITATVVPESDIAGTGYANFSILAYRKPEYKVQIIPTQEEYRSGETFSATLTGEYYFGGPMPSSSVSWRAVTQDYFFNKYTKAWYSFSISDSRCWYDIDCNRQEGFLTEGNGSLDASGKLSINFPLSIDDKPMSQGLAIEADITDKNNHVVSGHANVLVHKSDVYTGIRSDTFGVQAGQKASIDVITLKTDGSPSPNSSVRLTLLSREWNVIREKGVDGEYYYKDTVKDTSIQTVTVRTNGDGMASTQFVLPKGGEYLVTAETKDASGRSSKAGWSLYAWSGDYYNWPRSNNDRVPIITDKPAYTPGETAKLIVKSPYQGPTVKALVTVERENVLSKRIVTIEKNAQSIEIPITSDMIPTAYVSVTILKPRIGETFNENGLDTGAPAFKIGYVKLSIDTVEKKASISIHTDKKQYLPGEKVTVTLDTKNNVGKAMPMELSLAVVDKSLLDLAGFRMPEVLEQFYSERGLGVITSNMLAYLMERFKPGSKGGGGGGEDGQSSTRSNMLDTAFWKANIVTNAEGKATVSFTLPDNLTTWHLLAIGSSKDHRFGVASEEVIETKKVIVRPVRPRFAVQGDLITLGAIVHNYLDEKKAFTVSLSGTGFTMKGKSTLTVTLEPSASTKLAFPVLVNTTDSMHMTFSAKTDGGEDTIKETIPVFTFGVLQSNSLSGVTEDQVTEAVAVPSENDAPSGSLSVSVAPSLAVYLPTSLSFLSQYPYGCSEQTISALIPSIALKQLQGFEQFHIVSDDALQKNVQVGLQKLMNFQRSDGGFGYWSGSQESYPYLSAYILYGFLISKNAGTSVDPSMVDRGLTYLDRVVRSKDSGSLFISPADRAYILYVLSEYGRTDKVLILAETAKSKDLPMASRAYLALALQKSGELKKAKEILSTLEASATIDDRIVRFSDAKSRQYPETMNTNDTTMAIIARAYLRITPSSPLLPKILRGMLTSRHDGHWDTTQSTAQSVLTLVEYLKVSKELEYDFTATVKIGNSPPLQSSHRGSALVRSEIVTTLSELPRDTTVPINIAKVGKGKLYYDALLSYFYSPETIEPAEEGIGITRTIMPLTPSDKVVRVGTTQKVQLTITVPVTRYFVAVESMLPAGFEPIDLGYATSQSVLLGESANPAPKTWQDYVRNQMWRFSHIEYRDDRIFLFAEELPPGVYQYEYLVRATTPGTFRERPARVWEMYYPETFGQTSGGPITIKE